MSKTTIVVLFSLVVFFSGCESMKDHINAHLPKTSLQKQVYKGLDSASKDLEQMKKVDMLLQVNTNALAKIAASIIASQSKQISNVNLSFDNQAALMSADFFVGDENNVSFKGHLQGGASLLFTPNAIVILPAFTDIEVEKIENAPAKLDKVFTQGANALISAFLKNLNTMLANRSEMTVPMQYGYSEVIDMDTLLSKNKGYGIITQGSGKAVAELYVRRIVPNIQKERIQLAIEIGSGKGEFVSTPAVEAPEDEQLKGAIAKKSMTFQKRFHEKIKDIEPAKVQGDAYLAIADYFVSDVLNEMFTGVRLCGSFIANNVPMQISEVSIQPYKDIPRLECNPKPCNFSNAHCNYHKDKRECNRCLSRRPWGGCWLRGNDPLCELQKLAENTRREAVANACRADVALQKLDCERENVMANTGCEINKDWLDFIRSNDSIGYAGGHIRLTGKATACMDRFNIDADLTHAAIDLDTAASVDASGRIHFRPNRANLIPACVQPWDRAVNTTLEVPARKVTIKAKTLFVKEGNILEMKIRPLERKEIRAKLTPAPVQAVFGKYPELRIQCPLFGAVLLLQDIKKALDGKTDNPAYTGEYAQKIEPEYTARFAPAQMRIADSVYRGMAEKHGHALVYSLVKQP